MPGQGQKLIGAGAQCLVAKLGKTLAQLLLSTLDRRDPDGVPSALSLQRGLGGDGSFAFCCGSLALYGLSNLNSRGHALALSLQCDLGDHSPLAHVVWLMRR